MSLLFAERVWMYQFPEIILSSKIVIDHFSWLSKEGFKAKKGPKRYTKNSPKMGQKESFFSPNMPDWLAAFAEMPSSVGGVLTRLLVDDTSSNTTTSTSELKIPLLSCIYKMKSPIKKETT